MKMPWQTNVEGQERLTDTDSLFVDIHGLSVHYKEVGAGKPVFIFLHGFAASLFSWHEVMGPLSKLGRMIAYDRPAFGLTDRPILNDPQVENIYGTTGQVEMLRDLMDALGVDQAVIIAHSAGGTIGMAFALKYPQRVSALILVGPAVYLYSPVPRWARRFLVKKPVRLYGQVLIHPTRAFTRQILRQAWHDHSLISEVTVYGYKKPFLSRGWEGGLWEFSIAPHARNLWKRSSELKMPVLIVAGDDDRVIPTRHSRRLAEITPGAEFRLVRSCGHVPQEEKPGEFVEIVEKFYSEIK
jgi:pimeloyl-ACP methyl ester carboxylesterase